MECYKDFWPDNVSVVYDLLRHCNCAFKYTYHSLKKTEQYCVPIHNFNANTIHNVVQFKLRDFFPQNWGLQNEIKMFRMCTSNISHDSGEMVSGATGGEFALLYGSYRLIPLMHVIVMRVAS